MEKKSGEQIAKAKEMYQKGIKLVDIAARLGRPEGTIRRWKSTYGWESERSGEKSERSDEKRERSGRKKEHKEKPICEEVRQAAENAGLNDKQRLFCILYVKCFNATKAYQKAYGCSYETAMVNGSKLLRNAKVKDEILCLKQSRLNQEMLSEEDIFQKYIDIAFADITDYVEFGSEEMEVTDDTGARKTVKVNLVNVKDSKEVDGSILSEVSNGRNGVKVKLADRMKALDWLSAHMDMATAEQRARIEVLKRRASGDDQEAELEKLDKVLSEIKGVV